MDFTVVIPKVLFGTDSVLADELVYFFAVIQLQQQTRHPYRDFF